MPVKQLSLQSASFIADLVLTGRIETLHIEKREQGRNKGKFFAEYTSTEEENLSDSSRFQRVHVSEILEEVGEKLNNNQPIGLLFIHRDQENDQYLVQYQPEVVK